MCKYIIKSWLKEDEHAKYPFVWAHSATVCVCATATEQSQEGEKLGVWVTYMKFLSINVINGSSNISRISAKRSSSCSDWNRSEYCVGMCGHVQNVEGLVQMSRYDQG